MAIRSLLLVTLPFLVACSATPQPTPPRMITRPVQIGEKDRPLISTPGGEYTVTIEGRVTATGMTIPDATILIVTATGSCDFWGGV